MFVQKRKVFNTAAARLDGTEATKYFDVNKVRTYGWGRSYALASRGSYGLVSRGSCGLQGCSLRQPG